MTLILGMSKAEGIYMSVDYRVTDSRTSKLIDDASIKFLAMYYPPDKVGPKALLGYTGLAILPDGTPMGSWIRETLRGETNDTFNQSMSHLHDRLNRDIARLRQPLMINVLVLQGEQRYLAAFSNVPNPRTKVTADTTFETFGHQISPLSKPFWFANGGGAREVQRAWRLTELLNRQITVRPRDPIDHMKLLASVNRKAASRDKHQRVSPFCHVSFFPEDVNIGPKSQAFKERGESVPFKVPILLFGIDVSVLAEPFHKHAGAFLQHGVPLPATDMDAVNKQLRRRP